jgi:heme A synthase
VADKLSAEGLKSAADTTKQIITLSTGVITLTITFLDKIIQPARPDIPHYVPWTMFTAWVFFGLAILFGVITLGAITGTLDALDRQQNGQPLNADQTAAIGALSQGANVQRPARAMSIAFLVALALTIWTGFAVLR